MAAASTVAVVQIFFVAQTKLKKKNWRYFRAKLIWTRDKLNIILLVDRFVRPVFVCTVICLERRRNNARRRCVRCTKKQSKQVNKQIKYRYLSVDIDCRLCRCAVCRENSLSFRRNCMYVWKWTWIMLYFAKEAGRSWIERCSKLVGVMQFFQ